jgi:hypothetical protein
MSDRQAIPKLLLGTALVITTKLSVATADTATITIKGPTLTVMATANMTRDAANVYSYTYQSLDTHPEGDYIATITITSHGYTTVDQAKFTLVDQE